MGAFFYFSRKYKMMIKFNFSKIALALATGLTVTSCIKFEDKDNETDTEAIDTVIVDKPAEQAQTKQEITGAVYVYNDTKGVPEKVAGIKTENATPEELVEAINKYTGKGQVTLEYVKTSNDTVYVRIPDSAYLTQQMGTLGSHAYMATATYTLTQAKGINYVNFNFEEGDHAAPGAYKREDFKPNPIN
jgi:hypothetical protein